MIDLRKSAAVALLLAWAAAAASDSRAAGQAEHTTPPPPPAGPEGPLPRLRAEDAGQRPARRRHRAARAAGRGTPAHAPGRQGATRPAGKAGLAAGHRGAAHPGHGHPLGAADRRGDRLRGRQPRSPPAPGDRPTPTCSVTSDQLDLGFDLLSDVILHPSFPAEEIERWRSQALSGLQIQQQDAAYLADARRRPRWSSATTPTAGRPSGTPESLRRPHPRRPGGLPQAPLHPQRSHPGA